MHLSSSLSIHFRMKAHPRCFQSTLFSVVLMLSALTNFKIWSFLRHCGCFLGLFLFLGIQRRTLVIHLSSRLLARCSAKFHFNFFSLQMALGILDCPLIHFFRFLHLWVNPSMYFSMLLWFLWSFLKILLVSWSIS